jgi:hypothetical protein
MLIQDEHIHRLKKSLRDAVKSKHDDLQSVLDSHGKHKGAHAKELSKASLIQQQFARHAIYSFKSLDDRVLTDSCCD